MVDEALVAGNIANTNGLLVILAKLVALPVSTWNYIGEDPSVRHLGPMAQDFKAAFGLGDTDQMISMVDANGVLRGVLTIEQVRRALTTAVP